MRYSSTDLERDPVRVSSRVARATLFQVLGKILGAAIGLLVLGIAARRLEGDGFGHYATVLAYVGFAAVVADLGLGPLAARELAARGGDRASTFGNLLGLRVVAAVAILGLAALAAHALPFADPVRRGVGTAALAFAFGSTAQIFVAEYQVRVAMGVVAAAELIGRVVLLGVVLVCFRLGWGLEGILAGHAVANGVNLAILQSATRRSMPVGPRRDRGEWRRLVGESWPIGLSGILLFVYSRADLLILSFLEPAGVVGLYAAAYKIVEVVIQIPVLFAGFVVPLLAFASVTPDRAREIFQRAFDVLALFAIGLVTGGLALADPIVRFVSGDAFAPAALYFRLLIVAAGMLSLSTLPSFALVAIRKQRTMLWIYASMAALGLLLYGTLIPILSARGAAIGTLATETVFAVAGYVAALRSMKLRLRFGVAGRGVAGALVLSGVLAATPHWHVLLRIAVGGGAYAAALVALGAVPWPTIAGVFGKGEAEA